MLGVSEGDDVSDFLGITKYVPVIPSHMHGVVINAFGYTINYDIENYKNYPTALNEDVQVVMTEKLHGTWACFGYHPAVGTIVTSKGLSSRGLIFQLDDGVNDNNLYVQALMRTGDDHDGVHLVDRLRAVFGDYPIYVMGEVFGKGIQDLQYGSDRPQFRGFDVYVGAPGTGFYMDFVDKVDLFNQFGVGVVPILYVGSFSSTKVEELTTGKETVSGTSACIREGLVITPMVEMRSPDFGRLVLKSVSAQYLLRDGDDVTEYN
jgi:RNA ligase (TIGR02306 family)